MEHNEMKRGSLSPSKRYRLQPLLLATLLAGHLLVPQAFAGAMYAKGSPEGQDHRQSAADFSPDQIGRAGLAQNVVSGFPGAFATGKGCRGSGGAGLTGCAAANSPGNLIDGNQVPVPGTLLLVLLGLTALGRLRRPR